MIETNLTLEERASFEGLVQFYANTYVELVAAREAVLAAEARVSAAQHEINYYVNQRTQRIVRVVECSPPIHDISDGN